MNKKFESFRLTNLHMIRGGIADDKIYCKDGNGVNIGTVMVDCDVHGTSGLTACQAEYSTAQQSAGAC